MTFTNLNSLAADWRPIDTLARTLTRSFHAAQRRRRIAMTIRALERMDDHQLKDLGVRPGNIRDVARRIEHGQVD